MLRLLLPIICFTAIAPWNVQALWPIPTNLQTGTSFLKLAKSFDVKNNVHGAPKDLLDAISRTKSHIDNDKLQRLVVGRGADDSAAISHAPSLSGLSISLVNGASVNPIATEAVKPLADRSEGYSLTVPSDGTVATLTANTTLGLLRGLTTFEQLWYDFQGITYTYQAPIKIVNDVPAFRYRGFMLDTSRNYFPVADIKRTLDTMSWVKMSQFHWHIVDQHSFPLQVEGFTELATKGAYSSGEVYTTADVQDIIAFANARGIDLLMDIDTPGHTAAIAFSHPEHIACAFATPWASFASEPPAGQFRLASNATTAFAANLIATVAKLVTSSMFSTGGDEVNLNCYTQDAQTQADLKSSNRTFDQALDDFLHAEHAGIRKLGKTPVVKEDMILDHQTTLPNDTIVVVWKSSADASKVAAKNYRFIHQPSNYFYLDCGAGGWLGGLPNATSWCDPFKTWERTYIFDPFANLTDAQHSLVMGGQQPLWTEQSGPENLDSIVWPRAASSAEIFWTGATLPSGAPRNVTEALPRLLDIRYRMVQRGTKAIMLQPHWCSLRPGLCYPLA